MEKVKWKISKRRKTALKIKTKEKKRKVTKNRRRILRKYKQLRLGFSGLTDFLILVVKQIWNKFKDKVVKKTKRKMKRNR